jgi:hypothetical protein
MQQYVQQGLRDRLATDTVLLAWLASGPGSSGSGARYIFAEGDITPNVAQPPYCVLQFRGQRNDPRAPHGIYIQTWAVRLYQKDRGYFEIEDYLSQHVFTVLSDSTLVLPTAANVFCLTSGVRFIGFSNRGYDNVFRTQYESAMFEVHIGLKNV